MRLNNLIKLDLRGLMWVDDKNRDYVVVRRVSNCQYLGFFKKGDVHYREITLHMDDAMWFLPS
ncbi:BnaA02g37090D [Brassica napus]|uniref:BnaA02g37090D protein n=2 Tax=Brassica napus TaxID=3708 RepID=A0A078JDP8_BRANA|nr:BnaA02g37090D [Brassica napus]